MHFDESPTTPLGELVDVTPPPGRRPMLWGLSLAVVIVLATATLVVVGVGSATKSPALVLSQAQGRTSSTTAHTSAVETLTLNGQTTTILNLEGDEDFGNKSAAVTVNVGGRKLEDVRNLAAVTYLSVPVVALPNGAHWVSFTKADLKGTSASSALGSTDPGQGLAFFSAVDGDPRVLDKGRLDGVSVTHYGFNLNLASFFDRMQQQGKALNAPGFGSALSQLKSIIDLTKVPGEAWIDGGGRVHRFDLTLEFSQAGVSGKVVVDSRFSSFGEPVHVEAPAASDTVAFRDVPNFFNELANGAAKSVG